MKTLRGRVASKTERIIEGTVKMVSPENFSMDASEIKGKIMVAEFTFVDLEFLMKHAKAVLTERGGLLSHAAIISREFGIPCVVGIKNLTKELKDGDRIRIDFETGKIYVIS